MNSKQAGPTRRPVKFTNAALDALKPAADRYEVLDSEQRGLRIRVTPNGIKTFALLYRRPDGHLVRYTLGKYGTDLTVKEARDEALRIKGQARQKDAADPATEKKAKRAAAKRQQRIILRTFLVGDFADSIKAEQRSGAATVQRITAAFSEFLDKPLPDLTPWALQKWARERKAAGKSAYTIDRDQTALGTLFRYAMSAGLVSASPLRKPIDGSRNQLRQKLDPNQLPRYLSPAEESRLRTALADRDDRIRTERESANRWRSRRSYELLPAVGPYADHLTPMVLLVLQTGLRPGRELFELAWGAINTHASTLTVTGLTAKTGKSRTIPLNAEALAVLRTWRKCAAATDGLVFPSVNGKPFDNIKKAWGTVAATAKLRDCPPYALRHTFATRLVMANKPLPVVQKLMGHSSITMTMRYTHVEAADMRDAVDALAVTA